MQSWNLKRMTKCYLLKHTIIFTTFSLTDNDSRVVPLNSKLQVKAPDFSIWNSFDNFHEVNFRKMIEMIVIRVKSAITQQSPSGRSNIIYNCCISVVLGLQMGIIVAFSMLQQHLRKVGKILKSNMIATFCYFLTP